MQVHGVMQSVALAPGQVLRGLIEQQAVEGEAGPALGLPGLVDHAFVCLLVERQMPIHIRDKDVQRDVVGGVQGDQLALLVAGVGPPPAEEQPERVARRQRDAACDGGELAHGQLVVVAVSQQVQVLLRVSSVVAGGNARQLRRRRGGGGGGEGGRRRPAAALRLARVLVDGRVAGAVPLDRVVHRALLRPVVAGLDDPGPAGVVEADGLRVIDDGDAASADDAVRAVQVRARVVLTVQLDVRLTIRAVQGARCAGQPAVQQVLVVVRVPAAQGRSDQQVVVIEAAAAVSQVRQRQRGRGDDGVTVVAGDLEWRHGQTAEGDGPGGAVLEAQCGRPFHADDVRCQDGEARIAGVHHCSRICHRVLEGRSES